MSEKNGGPAFPVIGAPSAPEDYPGMSLRDYFAGQVLASGGYTITYIGSYTESAREMAASCYAIADAMLAEREKAGRS